MQRASFYYNFKTDVSEIFNKNIDTSITKMVNYFNKTKIFERPIKISKNMLSPYRKKGRTRMKRKSPEEGHDNTSENKKQKKNEPIKKYYPIIID